jgi:hypothetical protein
MCCLLLACAASCLPVLLHSLIVLLLACHHL